MPHKLRYYSIEEAAAFLGVSRWTIQRRIREGVLLARYRPGRADKRKKSILGADILKMM